MVRGRAGCLERGEGGVCGVCVKGVCVCVCECDKCVCVCVGSVRSGRPECPAAYV